MSAHQTTYPTNGTELPPIVTPNATSAAPTSVTPSISLPCVSVTPTAPPADVATLQATLNKLQATLAEERRQRQTISARIAALEAENARLKALTTTSK